jgi:hypothetical protein
MSQSRSREALLSFLDYLGQKGLMAPATATARKSAANKVFGILSDDEAEDVLAINLDDVMQRFSHLQGKGFTPGSLNTYRSRIRSSLDDFAAYVENPLAFRPKIQSRKKSENGAKVSKQTTATEAADEPIANPSSRPAAATFVTANILPIPIRSDLVIQIQGLPFDLTESEAKRISNVILALAS